MLARKNSILRDQRGLTVLGVALLCNLLLAQCKPAMPMCARVMGQWQGDSVESSDPTAQASFAAIAASVRWTITATTFRSEAGRIEQMRVVQNDSTVCRVELSASPSHGLQQRELRVQDDQMLHANTVNEPARIVLRRVSEQQN
jgi:hypothetical protein